ncbi:hypothetical protein ACF0H5_021813 [Mactra antiquata]
MLILKAMGCGRSKNQSPKLGNEEKDTNKEKSNGKKKKGKGDRKENKDPCCVSDGAKSSKMSPVKTIVNSLKPSIPSNSNSSPTHYTGLHLDVDYSKPTRQSKSMDQLPVPGKKDMKEFGGGRSNIKVTSSQIAFFKMLDEKIEQGDDYTSDHSLDLSDTKSCNS